jgi:serine/threonine protein kinase
MYIYPCRTQLRGAYNHVGVEDFQYMELLGSGGFGRVVCVRKRSTGRHYAMKVQHKRALVNHYRNDHQSLGSEMAALATCSHPFILHMVSNTFLYVYIYTYIYVYSSI